MKIGIDIGNSFASVASLNHEGEPTLLKDVGSKKEWEVFTPMRIQIEDQFAFIGQSVNELLLSNYSLNYCGSFFEKLGQEDFIYIDDSQKEWSATELMALVLRKLKLDAESHTTEKLEAAVAVVPSYFTPEQKTELERAFSWGGMPLQHLVEDYRAALAGYGFSSRDREEKTFLIYDLGREQFHFSVIRCGNGTLKELFTSDRLPVGGAQLEEQVLEFIKEQFQQATGKTFIGRKNERLTLQKQAELIKVKLSSPFLPFVREICVLNNQPVEIIMTRVDFERVGAPVINQTIEFLKSGLAKRNISIQQLDHVLVVGGSGKVNLVQTKLQQFFQDTRATIICESPRTVMTAGAAVLAYENSEEVEIEFSVPTKKNTGGAPYSLTLTTRDLIKDDLIARDCFLKGEKLPVSRSVVFSTFFPGQKNLSINVIKNKNLGDLSEVLGIIEIDIPDLRDMIAVEIVGEYSEAGDLTFYVKERRSRVPLNFNFSGTKEFSAPQKIKISKKPLKVFPGKKKIAVKVQNGGRRIKVEKEASSGEKSPVKEQIKIITSDSKNPGRTPNSSVIKTPQVEGKKYSPEEKIKEMILNNIW